MEVLYKRISKYMSGHDGTRLAVDLYLPQISEKVPLLLKAGYAPRREVFEDERNAILKFLQARFAVAIVEVRGSGSSFGVSDGFFGLHDGKDIANIIDTLTLESWCNGKAGTYGGSNYGMSQEVTLLEKPERLFASIPCDCSMDFYDQNFPNGCSAVPQLSARGIEEQLGEPVDEDTSPNYPLAHEALACHYRNLPFLAQHFKNMYRDDIHPMLGYKPNIDVPAWERMDIVRYGKAKVWGTGAWFDPGCTNKILTFKSWGGKLILGPWPHVGIYKGVSEYPNAEYNWVEDYIRYFNACLKDEDNGILSQPPVKYYTVGNNGEEWRYEADFPVTGTLFSKLYLTDDAKLSQEVPKQGATKYTVRTDIMIYQMENGGRMNRNITKDMTAQDDKSIVFTSDAIAQDMELTGIPLIELWATSNYHDGNFIACLEEVTCDGISHFVTEGMMRASHGKEHVNNIYESMGMVYHRGYKEDAISLSENSPIKLSFHFEAISKIIKAKSKLRISISCAGSGFDQPVGFPKNMPTVKIYSGHGNASSITLPVIKPTITKFNANNRSLYVFKKAVYIEEQGKFTQFSCKQVYPLSDNILLYETAFFNVKITTVNNIVTAEIAEKEYAFFASAALPERYIFDNGNEEIPLSQAQDYPKADKNNLYVATVPVEKGVHQNMNIQLRSTFDLLINIIYPKTGTPSYPCIINIHGFGGNHHQFESNTEMLLNRGYAVASIDYRLCPPNLYPTAIEDSKACVRYLKANASKLNLKPDRFGIIGGSMGGYLTAMLAATNGCADNEGNIGGNTHVSSSVKAAAAYYSFTDFFNFAEDSASIWPSQPEKITQSDGPFAPLGSLLGHVGVNKGMGDIKKHLWDNNPLYKQLVQMAKDASPIYHVTENSAPMCLVHGIYECGIQVPIGQSIRMFNAYTTKGVKSLLLCNNNGIFGEDPEVKNAVVEFLISRV